MMEHLVQCRSPCAPIPCSTLCTPPPCSTLCTPPPCSTPCTPPCVLHVDLAGVVEGGKQGPPAGDGYLIYWLEGDHFAYHSTSFYQHQAEEQWQKSIPGASGLGWGPDHTEHCHNSVQRKRDERRSQRYVLDCLNMFVFSLLQETTPQRKKTYSGCCGTFAKKLWMGIYCTETADGRWCRRARPAPDLLRPILGHCDGGGRGGGPRGVVSFISF